MQAAIELMDRGYQCVLSVFFLSLSSPPVISDSETRADEPSIRENVSCHSDLKKKVFCDGVSMSHK